MKYEDWLAGVHPRIKAEPIWKSIAYQKALFLYDLAWEDCDKLQCDIRGRKVAEQLIASTGSITANMEEGHGRGYGKERQHFLRIALGSARETKGWYQCGRHLLSCEVFEHRLALLDEVIALLITELSYQKQHLLKPR